VVWPGPLPIFLVQGGEVGGVGEQHAHLDDIGEVGTARLEDGLAVRQGLAGLSLDRISGQFAGAWVDADDARNDQPRPGLDPLAVRAANWVRSRW
jgi:hypothetical protein